MIFTPLGIIENGKLIKKFKDLKEALEEFEGKEWEEGELNEILKVLGISEEEYFKNLKEFSILLTKKRVKEGFSKDKLVIQAAELVDELNKVINLLFERFMEFYGFYFPEATQKIIELDDFLKYIKEVDREKVAEKLGIKEESMGFDPDEKDLKILQSMADNIRNLVKFKEEIVKYIEKVMEEIAPNLNKIAGPVIGAKLISLAGGLKQLAILPSSTIQVLGAEKALFRHLTKGTKPPKHGILFQHPYVRKAKFKNRGKIARTLAAKISIAARVDYFGKGEKIYDKLLKEIEERLKELGEKP